MTTRRDFLKLSAGTIVGFTAVTSPQTTPATEENHYLEVVDKIPLTVKDIAPVVNGKTLEEMLMGLLDEPKFESNLDVAQRFGNILYYKKGKDTNKQIYNELQEFWKPVAKIVGNITLGHTCRVLQKDYGIKDIKNDGKPTDTPDHVFASTPYPFPCALLDRSGWRFIVLGICECQRELLEDVKQSWQISYTTQRSSPGKDGWSRLQAEQTTGITLTQPIDFQFTCSSIVNTWMSVPYIIHRIKI
jgi:hypothetical protein